MKVKKVFLVACYESMLSEKMAYIAVYGTKTHGEPKFTICHSDLEESLKDEYPDRNTFERIHNDPEWIEDLDYLSDEMEAFPWTRGTLYYALPEYQDQIGYLVYRTQASEGDAWVDFKINRNSGL